MSRPEDFEVNPSGTFKMLDESAIEREELKDRIMQLEAENAELRKQLDLKTPEGLRGVHQ